MISGQKGHVARNCDMRGKCIECKQPGHFQQDCLLCPHLDPVDNIESVHANSAHVGPLAENTDGAAPQEMVIRLL